MSTTCRSTKRDRTFFSRLTALVVASSLVIIVQQGQAFQTNMFTTTATLRRVSAAAVGRAAAAATQPQPRQLASTNCRRSALSMAWGDDREIPRSGKQVDRGFSSGGVVDKSFSDNADSSSADTYPSSGRESGSGGRSAGGLADAYRGGGGGGGREERNSGGRGGGGEARGNYRGGGSRDGGGGGSGSGGRYEQRGRGRGRGWDQAANNRGGRRGGRGGERRRGDYDQSFGGRESRGRGGGSSNWDDSRGRGRGGEGRGRGGRGGRSYGGRDNYPAGRQTDFGPRESAGDLGPSLADGPSRAWAPESGGDGGEERAWGAGRGRGGGAERYVDEDDEGYGQEEEEGGVGEGGEGLGASRSSPASDWMRGQLSNYQAEMSPNSNSVDEDTNFDMVYGIAPVLNVLRNNRREKLGLYCQDGLAPANKKDRAAANQIYDLARETDVPMTTTDKGYLNTLCGNRPHQGFILKARPLQFEPILFLPRIEDNNNDDTDSPKEATAPTIAESSPADNGEDGDGDGDEDKASPKKPPAPLATAATGQVWLALDEVTDPQNFGALLRSAHFFGASGVVTCAKNSASLTATVSKASAGAVEVMRVHSTANMMRFLKRSRENGWRVVGTSVTERSGPLHELSAGPGAPPTIVVLGNEGYGVRTNVLRECEFLVEVAGDGGGAVAEGATSSTVDSLNVSVTGGVVLFHLLAGAKHAAAYMSSPAAAGSSE